MRTKHLFALLTLFLTSQLCYGQVNILDSCGLDASPVLNQYEIKVLDSVVFAPFKTKKAVIDPKRGFDFAGKKLAFFSCTKNSNTKGDGLLSKKEFFALFKPVFGGHPGRGIIAFNEKEKAEARGFDAVVIIDCPYPRITSKELISKLALKYN